VDQRAKDLESEGSGCLLSFAFALALFISREKEIGGLFEKPKKNTPTAQDILLNHTR
jgi:hypothetical protein